MSNLTLSKSLYLLSHPISLLSIILLFINDHVLRVFWPSWVTGKLGDFTWLLFMPFALAAILSIVIPCSVRNHTKIVGCLSFGSVGLLFLFGNSLPSMNRYMVEWLERLLSFQIQITRDPTDLMALFSLILGWSLWKKKYGYVTADKRKGVILLSVTALLTIANMAKPDQGIECFQIENNKIIASSSYYESYLSDDGGLSWQQHGQAKDNACGFLTYQYYSFSKVVSDPEDESKLFRMNEEKEFEYSPDKGKSWKKVPMLTLYSQAELAFIQMNRRQTAWYEPGPFHVIRDSQTNNLIFAMGLEGVLVHKPSGEWLLVQVGEYGLEKLAALMISYLLFGEIILAFILAMLVFCALSLTEFRSWFRIALLIVLWAIWIFIAVGLQPALNTGFGVALQNLLLLFLGVVTLLNTFSNVRRMRQQYHKELVYYLAKISLLGSIAFLIPYILWSVNIIPLYTISVVLGLLFCLVIIVVGRRKMDNTSKEGQSA